MGAIMEAPTDKKRKRGPTYDEPTDPATAVTHLVSDMTNTLREQRHDKEIGYRTMGVVPHVTQIYPPKEGEEYWTYCGPKDKIYEMNKSHSEFLNTETKIIQGVAVFGITFEISLTVQNIMWVVKRIANQYYMHADTDRTPLNGWIVLKDGDACFQNDMYPEQFTSLNDHVVVNAFSMNVCAFSMQFYNAYGMPIELDFRKHVRSTELTACDLREHISEQSTTNMKHVVDFPRKTNVLAINKPIRETTPCEQVMENELTVLVELLFERFECKYKIHNPHLVMQELQAIKFFNKFLYWKDNEGVDKDGVKRKLAVFSFSTRHGTLMAKTEGTWNDKFMSKDARFGPRAYMHITNGLALSTNETFYEGEDARMFVGIGLVVESQIYTHVQDWHSRHGHVTICNACYATVSEAGVQGYYLPLVMYNVTPHE